MTHWPRPRTFFVSDDPHCSSTRSALPKAPVPCRRRRATRDPTAADRQRGSADETGFIAEQKGHEGSYLVRRAEPADRRSLETDIKHWWRLINARTARPSSSVLVAHAAR
jgi:hypothetical protein